MIKVSTLEEYQTLMCLKNYCKRINDCDSKNQYSKYCFESYEICKELIEKWGHEKIARYILGIDL